MVKGWRCPVSKTPRRRQPAATSDFAEIKRVALRGARGGRGSELTEASRRDGGHQSSQAVFTSTPVSRHVFQTRSDGVKWRLDMYTREMDQTGLWVAMCPTAVLMIVNLVIQRKKVGYRRRGRGLLYRCRFVQRLSCH